MYLNSCQSNDKRYKPLESAGDYFRMTSLSNLKKDTTKKWHDQTNINEMLKEAFFDQSVACYGFKTKNTLTCYLDHKDITPIRFGMKP